MWYVLGKHESNNEMIRRAGLATMWSEIERIHVALASKVIEHLQVGVHIVDVIDVRWILVRCPVLGQRRFHVERLAFWFRLVIYWVKARNLQQQNMNITIHELFILSALSSFIQLTCIKNLCKYGWELGSLVTSNKGMKILYNIWLKFSTSLLALKISLLTNRTKLIIKVYLFRY